MSRVLAVAVRRLRGLLGPDPGAARQSLVALSLGLSAALVAGLMLGGISSTLEELPGLLVLVPGAIGLRGTIFGALGSRLGTAIHAGTFRATLRPDSVLGQNLQAAAVLTLATSVALGVMAKVVAAGFGVDDTITTARFVAISLVGGIISSVLLAGLTVALASTAARRDWDPDNVMAPLVTASGDMVTLPALFLATVLVRGEQVSNIVALVGLLAASAALTWAVRAGGRELRSIVRESVPVVVVAGLLSLIAGLLLEKQIARLVAYPALLSLVPPFLASAGSLGGIVSNRLTSKLHLGVIEPSTLPSAGARVDVALAYTLALPVFALSSLVADLAALIADLDSPGPLAMLAVATVGGVLATTFAMAVAYWSAVLSYRVGIDPDNVGIPLVTSSIDLVGSFSFILAVLVFV